MKCNVGATDRLVRIIVGVIVLLLGFYFKTWWGLLGLIFIVTGLLRFCPLYVPFKISTILKK